MSQPIAVIVDIVRSRELDDRGAAQSAIEDAFEIAASDLHIPQWLHPTVGDEFQVVFSDVSSALRVTGLLRLALPDGVDCRFGFGRGEVRDVEIHDASRRSGAAIQDGSAWWRARQAIEEAHRREDRRSPELRGWFISEATSSELDALVNAFLLTRDAIIGPMHGRERRLTAGILLGRSQSDLARHEKITQPAVSQNLRRSGGAALVAAHELFDRVACGKEHS